jgi:hypothetical protein
LVLGRWEVGVGAGIPGFSLSLTLSVAPFVVSDTSAHLLFPSRSFGWRLLSKRDHGDEVGVRAEQSAHRPQKVTSASSIS